MSRVHFVVVDTSSGAILRTGQCWDEDAGLQGETVLIFPDDPGVCGLTHCFDAKTGALAPIHQLEN